MEGVQATRLLDRRNEFKNPFTYTIVSVAALAVGGCTSKILPRKDAMSFSVVESNDEGKKTLTVSGFSADSSMVVYKTDTQEHGDKLLIVVL